MYLSRKRNYYLKSNKLWVKDLTESPTIISTYYLPDQMNRDKVYVFQNTKRNKQIQFISLWFNLLIDKIYKTNGHNYNQFLFQQLHVPTQNTLIRRLNGNWYNNTNDSTTGALPFRSNVQNAQNYFQVITNPVTA